MNGPALRRLIHASSALVLLLAHFGSVDLFRYTLAAGALLALVLDSLRLTRPAFGVFLGTFLPVFRVSEAKKLSGATWLSLGYAAAAWFPLPAATAGVLVGALADPAASLAGSKVARQGVQKTWVGSVAAAVTAALVILLAGFAIPAAVCGALAAMALERWSSPLNDNLVVAPGVALVVWLLL